MPLPSLPALSPQVFAILSSLIEERTGIHYAISDLELVREKVGNRALDAGFESLLDYYYYLRYDAESAAEFERLVESLVVGETYFFREFDQQRVLTRRLIPDKLKEQERVRVWSAACATGEEPLTLAMLLEAEGVRDKVEIVASDISRKALARAQSGKFGRRSVRSVPERAVLEAHVTGPADDLRVDPALVASIDWRQINLVDEAQVKALGTFDFILCRNVLIYFRDETARKVVQHLTSALVPDGSLLVSVSESLLRFGTLLRCEEHEGVFVYRKAAR